MDTCWKIAGRIETCIGAARHWTRVLPRTLRALATDIEAMPDDHGFGTYKPSVDRLMDLVNRQGLRRFGKEIAATADDDVTDRPLRDKAADALRALADAIDAS